MTTLQSGKDVEVAVAMQLDLIRRMSADLAATVRQEDSKRPAREMRPRKLGPRRTAA